MYVWTISYLVFFSDIMLDYMSLGLIGVTSTLIAAWYKLSGQSFKTPPGPRSWPILGSALDATPGAIHRDLGRWHEQYGDMFTLNLLGGKIVVLSNKDLIRDALVTRSEAFGGRPHTFRLNYVSHNGKGLVFR